MNGRVFSFADLHEHLSRFHRVAGLVAVNLLLVPGLRVAHGLVGGNWVSGRAERAAGKEVGTEVARLYYYSAHAKFLYFSGIRLSEAGHRELGTAVDAPPGKLPA